MEKNFKRTTVTAALPYANGGVHIGHLAGVYVPADIYVRYLRLKKKDVIFIGGSDEHGVPVTIRARKEGISVQEVVDRYHKLIKDSFAEFGISFDIYSRTTSKIHHKFTAQVYVLTKDEGGRHTPFFNNYRPQFYFRTTDVTGICELPAGTEMCMPGDNVEMTIELIHPVAMEQGLTFAIREGGRTVGSGRVATIIE